ncbi:unnamed protein product [Cuscuta europaea]|uniref:C2 domain-containing protein n=1 Tax=Cuscuta europaea TaxID=41803 RepID=A0A9P0YVN2_CUSEU|nr:unnamed protein product [Cuscuta europaea]
MDTNNSGTPAASSVVTVDDGVSSLNRPPSHHILEITLVSAHDLAPVSKSLHAYALIWIHPNRKRTTNIDQHGHTSPTWNSNFSFKVDREFLASDDSAVSVEIYAVSWFRDVLVGTVSVKISNLFSPAPEWGKRSVALQIRRPSGAPQGMLNMEVSLLDSESSGGTLLADIMSTSSGFRKSLELDRRNVLESENGEDAEKQRIGEKVQQWRRSMSLDMSGMNCEDAEEFTGNPGSVCNGSTVNCGSEVCSDVGPSASIVAAEIARNRQRSSMLTSEDSAQKGLTPKMERWRRDAATRENDEIQTMVPKRGHWRRNSDSSVYSCFVYGFQFTIVCGTKKKKSISDELSSD